MLFHKPPIIRALELENFQSIKGRTRLEFSKLTYLFGPNSAGKSTIFDAILLIKDICSFGAKIDPTKWFRKGADYCFLAIELDLVEFHEGTIDYNISEILNIFWAYPDDQDEEKAKTEKEIEDETKNISPQYHEDISQLKVFWTILFGALHPTTDRAQILRLDHIDDRFFHKLATELFSKKLRLEFLFYVSPLNKVEKGLDVDIS